MSPRPLTPQEQAQMLHDFPNANVAAMTVLGPASSTYKCLAWTLNILNAWVWPWSNPNVSRAQFDALYQAHHYTIAGGPVGGPGDVAAYGISVNDMTHGAVVYGGQWTSKLGAWLLVSHTLADLAGPGSLYGYVNRYYDYPHASAKSAQGAVAQERPMLLDPLTDAEETRLNQKVKRVPQDLVSEFDTRYKAWRATWYDENNAMFSSPQMRTRSNEFMNLITMGPDIVPLLMKQLRDPDQFFALQALEVFLDPALVYRPDLDHPDVLKGEQARARTTLKRWLISC
jgi:hypothetical protein